jgi:hypothetical protein
MAVKDEAERTALVGEAPKATSQVVSAHTSETSPAPPLASTETMTDVPSARPTSVPDYEEAFMSKGMMSFDPHAHASLAIPKRVPGADASSVPHAAAYALMHVDGVSTIATIAEVADLPQQDVVMYFLEMTALGIVTMGELRPGETVPPASHVKRK